MKNNKRFYTIGLLVCFLVAAGSFFLPESLGDNRSLIFGIGVVCMPIFVIALIVASVKAKRQAKTLGTSEPRSAFTAGVPNPVPVPSSIPDPAPTGAPAQAPKPEKNGISTERIHVRGISNYVENILSVATENPDYDLTKKELEEEHPEERVWQYEFHAKGALVPEPDNEYDPNAIMVQADGLCIGYVPKGSTAHVRKLMESGRVKSVWLNIGGGKYRGVYENDDGKYELDSGEKDFSAVVELVFTDD